MEKFIPIVMFSLVGLAYLGTVSFGIYVWRSGVRHAKRVEKYEERTTICPTCYGRGRVPKEDWQFVKDRFREEYELQQHL